MNHIIQFSGGVTSWAAARLTADEFGPDNILLLFADTYIEDQDNYRFIIEGAANLLGVPVPDFINTTIPEVTSMLTRVLVLDKLRGQANDYFQGKLAWIAEGRDPWRVFNDEMMIGNTRADMCSRILKRELLMRWLELNAPDQASNTLVHGLSASEGNRALRFAHRYAGWPIHAPLVNNPLLTKRDCLDLAKAHNIPPPRMYAMGFSHANCGGFCVKAGQDNFLALLTHFPERYAHHEHQEQLARNLIGKNVAIMRDRKGGETKPLTMEAFRSRYQATGQYDAFDVATSCGCAVDD